jgi:hypothetical protein
MGNTLKYDDAVLVIKSAILQSQYDAARSVNEKQLMLYYGIGKYISLNSRKGFWSKGAIDAISERLQKELPGLRGFSARSLRDMRIFYEEWAMLDNSNVPIEMAETYGDGNLAPAGAKLEIEKWHPVVPKSIVDYVIRDYSSPMGVATYKTAKDMPEKLKNALPDVEDLRRLLDNGAKGDGK